MRIAIIEEMNMSRDLDEKIRRNLCVCFPSESGYFSRSRGWNEVASDSTVVMLNDEQDPIAHIGVIFRTIYVEGSDYHVFGIQNVYVMPQHRGKKIVVPLFSALLENLHDQHLDFGLLFCRPKVEHVYARLGWSRAEDAKITIRDVNGTIRERQLIHDSMFFYPMNIKTPPVGAYFLNGPDW